jgi:hypothetical protein
MSKTSTSARDILDRITGKRQALADTQREIEQLEKEARWAEGAERRSRLAAAGAQAVELAGKAEVTGTQLADAAAAVTHAVREVHRIAGAHNTALAAIREAIVAEKVGVYVPTAPPSPADASVALLDSTVIVGDTRISPVNGEQIAKQAADAADTAGAIVAVPVLVTQVAPQVTRYWRDRTSRNIFVGDRQPSPTCEELHQVEYLSATWKIAVRDLPAEYLDALTPAERARLAEQLLPGDAA